MSNDNRMRSMPADTRGLPRGGTIINILTGVMLLGLMVAGILWMMKTTGEAGEQYATTMINTKDKSLTLACQINFRSIAQSLQAYAIGNESFPDSRQELASFCSSSKLLRCPDPCGVDYVYIPGARADMPPTTVLVYEPEPMHDGRCNVLFLDGRIEALRPEELQPLLDATLARRR